jgi:hypothetical protein
MKVILMSLLLINLANAEERIYLGTLYQGPANEIYLHKDKAGNLSIEVQNVIEWDEDEDLETITKKIPGLKWNKRDILYNGHKIARLKFLRADNLSSFNNSNAYIESIKVKYCSQYFNNDCIEASNRYNVYLVIK